jgi:hypothetical protein
MVVLKHGLIVVPQGEFSFSMLFKPIILATMALRLFEVKWFLEG